MYILAGSIYNSILAGLIAFKKPYIRPYLQYQQGATILCGVAKCNVKKCAIYMVNGCLY